VTAKPANPFEGGLTDDEVKILAVFFIVERPTHANIRGCTGFNEIRARGPLNSTIRRGLVHRRERHFELTNRAAVVTWLRANRPNLLPKNGR